MEFGYNRPGGFTGEVWTEDRWTKSIKCVVVVVLLSFYVHCKHLWSCRDGQLAYTHFSWAGSDLPPKRLTSTWCTYFRQ